MSDRPADDAHALVGRLYDAYGPSLYRYAVMLLADPAAAEDVIHQVFTAILRRPPDLEQEAHYLRRAVRNECFSHLRRRQADLRDAAARPILEPVTAGVSDDDRIGLERAITMLSPEQREVVHWHVFEGMTFQEIANASDVSINTIAARYRYALARLRQLL